MHLQTRRSWHSSPTTPRTPGQENPNQQFSNITDTDALRRLPKQPPEFITSNEFYDASPSFGLDFPRVVKHTAFAINHNVQGMDVGAVPLLPFLHHQWISHWARVLAHGKPIHLVVTKEMRDAVFAGELMAQLRQRHINIDTIAANHAAEQDQPADKKLAITFLVSEIVEFFKTFQSGKAVDVAGNNRVAELEKQLRETQQQLATQSQQAQRVDRPTTPDDRPADILIENKATITTTSAAPINSADKGLTDQDVEETVEQFNSPVEDAPLPPQQSQASDQISINRSTRPAPIDVHDETPPQKIAKTTSLPPTDAVADDTPFAPAEATSSSATSAFPTAPKSKVQKSIFQIMGKNNKPVNEIDVAMLLHQPVKASEFLVQNYKGSTTEKQLMRWLGSLALPNAKLDKLKNWIQRATKFYDDLPDPEKTGLDSILVRWGLPAKQIGKLQGNAAVIVIGVALFTKE